MTTAQVSEYIGKSVRTVHRLAATGRLTATRVPGYKGPLLFNPDDVERLRVELAGEAPPRLAQALAS